VLKEPGLVVSRRDGGELLTRAHPGVPEQSRITDEGIPGSVREGVAKEHPGQRTNAHGHHRNPSTGSEAHSVTAHNKVSCEEDLHVSKGVLSVRIPTVQQAYTWDDSLINGPLISDLTLLSPRLWLRTQQNTAVCGGSDAES
jgi:hypothetical protein